jgi:uncharacterized protein
MTYLPDVNLWIALASDRHIHHQVAKEWFEELAESPIAFCRITELGFLRLLVNRQVMGGDALSPKEAWGVYETILSDSRVFFRPEEAGFSDHWRKIGQLIEGGANAWTDAYLAAFASHAGLTVATFDRRFRALGSCEVQFLNA